MDYFSLPSGNLASAVPSEYFDFTQLFLCCPSDCSVWLLYTQRISANEQKKIIINTTTIRSRLKKKYSQGEWKRRDIVEPCDTEVGRRLGLVPIEQHVKDGGSYGSTSSSKCGTESNSSSSDSDHYRARKRGRRRKRSKHVREVEKIKKLRSNKSKTYRRKSGKDRDKSRHASKGDGHEPIYAALVIL